MTIVKPDIPGTVIRWIGSTQPRVNPSAARTVAVPIIHDWGPVGADVPGTTGIEGGPQLVESFDEFTRIYGDSDTPGRTAIAGCFAGSGMPGEAGAGAIIVWRMATVSGAKATLTITNTTPASAITLTARYKGVRGNSLSVIIDVDPSNAARDRLRILYSGVVQETYLYTNTDIASLVSQITLQSKIVTATQLITGVRLTATAGTSLAGGNDGSTLTSVEHVAALNGLAFAQFGILSPYDLTSAPIVQSYLSWVQAQNVANLPVRLVIGGAAAELMSDAVTRTNTLLDEHVVNVGMGTWHDDLLNKDLSTSQLAPRIAGILAAKGERSSLTSTRLAGIHNVNATMPTTNDIQTAVTSGVTVFEPTSDPDADVRIAKGVTTYVANTLGKPKSVFGSPRLIGIMDDYVRNMKQWGDNNIVGKVPVNDDSRATVRGKARQLQDDLETQGLILPGDDVVIPKPFVNVINTDADPTLSDAIPYQFGWQFAQTANAILAEGMIR